MSKFLRGLGSFIGIVGGILGFILSLFVVYAMFGIGGVVGGLFLFPVVFTVLPLYTAFALGNWTLLLMNYGSAGAYWFLHKIADDMEKQEPELPAVAPVPAANPLSAPIAKPVSSPVEEDNSARNIVLWVVGIVAFFWVLNYFSQSGSSNPTPTARVAQVAASTSTPRPRPTATQKPISLHACVTNSTIWIRKGPGTQYERIDGLGSGICMEIVGRNSDSSWVYMLSDDNKAGWVSADLLTIEGNLARVSIRTASEVSNLVPAAKIQPTVTRKPFILASSTPRQVVSPSLPLCSEATNGDLASCKIPVAYCDYLPDVDGSPTFCNDRPYPDQNFALVVFGENWSDYDGYCLIVTGTVSLYRGVPQILATSRSQVSYCE